MGYAEESKAALLSSLKAKGFHFNPQHKYPVPSRIKNYQSGTLDRLTASFKSTSYSADGDIYPALRIMRARARQLAMNNVYMKKFIDSLPVNILGRQGLALENQAKDDNGQFDKSANQLIEDAWDDWSREGICDVTGELSLHDALCLGLKTTGRDGEYLIRIVRGWTGNKYRLALQLIEADQLDETYNRLLPNGNRIIMGVEKDAWNRRVAYHILDKHPGDIYYAWGGTRYQVIPAADILPVMLPDRIGQTRGVPWAYAAMLTLNHLGAYTDAAIINARIGASKMGFYTKTGDLDPAAVSDDTDARGEFITEVEPGAFGILPDGYDFKDFNPTYPNSEFEPFSKAMLRGIASGLGIAYSSISADLADVNFSSMRSGKIDERDAYKFLQRWYIQKTVAKLFPIWLDTALMVGAISFNSGKTLPYSKLDKFNQPFFQARGFDWVDPLKDIEADIMAINFGLKTRSEVAAERGKDLRDVYEKLAEEEKLAKEYGLVFTFGKTAADNKPQVTDPNADPGAMPQKKGAME